MFPFPMILSIQCCLKLMESIITVKHSSIFIVFLYYIIMGYMFRILSSRLQALKMGIPQCSKRLYVWIYIMRA